MIVTLDIKSLNDVQKIVENIIAVNAESSKNQNMNTNSHCEDKDPRSN